MPKKPNCVSAARPAQGPASPEGDITLQKPGAIHSTAAGSKEATPGPCEAHGEANARTERPARKGRDRTERPA
jgi:hypothetical protein